MGTLKGLAIFGIVILDLMILIAVIDHIGIRIFSKFSLYYIIGLTLTSIFTVLFGQLSDSKVKQAYINSGYKVNMIYLSMLPFYLLVGLIFLYFYQDEFFTIGILTGISVAIHISIFSKDFIYSIEQYKESLEVIAGERYPWLKK